MHKLINLSLKLVFLSGKELFLMKLASYEKKKALKLLVSKREKSIVKARIKQQEKISTKTRNLTLHKKMLRKPPSQIREEHKQTTTF